LEHDSPLALLRTAARELLEHQLLRPGVSTLERLVASARALQEYGRLVKTRFVLGYLADETERRAIGRQQNKGESLHALHDRIFHGNHDTVRLHTLERQSTQAHCLHLVANAIIYWNTIYSQHALDALPAEPDGAERAGLTPALFEHINALGAITFDTSRPAGQLRPLRASNAA